MIEPEYFLVGDLPVKFLPTPEGGRAVLRMSWTTGAFELDLAMWDRINYTHGGVRQVPRDRFIEHVEAIRARTVSGEGPVFALYKLVNGIEDVAREEGRALRPDEEAVVAALRRQSYELFQAEHPDPAGQDPELKRPSP